MFSACRKTAIALLLGIVGLCAAPAGAQIAPPRLLFLGISKDNRAYQPAETAVQLRLAGLDVSIVRPKGLPPCEEAGCLQAALAFEHADLALAGRILKNEHACLATLWLAASKGQERPIEQDIACRPDGKDGELGATLADGAAALIDDYLRSVEPAPVQSVLKRPLAVDAGPKTEVGTKKKLSGKKKALIAGLGILLSGGLVTTITFASISPNISRCEDNTCLNIMSFRSITASAGIASGALLASLLFWTIK